MPAKSYERYGLTGNPFRDLTSESLQDVELLHVTLQTDDALRVIKDEVLDKENRAFVALAGSHGTGKTHRLKLAEAEAKERGQFCVYLDVSEKSERVLSDLAKAFLAAKPMGGFSKIFSAPPWYREMVTLEKPKGGKYDPIVAGKALANALNANAPAFLLLNDLQNLNRVSDAEPFLKTLQNLSDGQKPGTLVMFGCYPSYLVAITKAHPALATRVNRTFLLPTLSVDEASLLVAKKLLAKRIVENLDPLYPYDREALVALNAAAHGNPRRLLELADRALEYAVDHRSYRIDGEIVAASMPPTHPLDMSGSAVDGLTGAPTPEVARPVEIRPKPTGGG